MSAPNPEQGYSLWLRCVSELLGTAILLAAGLSLVIALNGVGSALATLEPVAVRRAVTGFCFGCVGMLVSVSPLGRISGAHLNPAVTFAFWLERRISARNALAYGLSQCLGAALGCVGLLEWGSIGSSVHFGATLPASQYSPWIAMLAETACTYLLVSLVFVMGAHRRSQRCTPFTLPILYGMMVWLEAPLSGASTNPARSLGPALVTGLWRGQWLYWLGPLCGAALAVAILKLPGLKRHRPKEARVAHFEDAPAVS